MKKQLSNPSKSTIGNKRFSFAQLNRSAGILLHITSLPSAFGIGDFGPEAKQFAQFLQRSGQTFWQLLPLHPTTTGSGNSPYSANSAMAGNLLFISPELLIEEHLLTQQDVAGYHMQQTDTIDFKTVEKNKCAILEMAYANWCKRYDIHQKEFTTFCKQETYWLDDFALYSVLRQVYENKPWYEWETPFKQREKKALQQFKNENKDEVNKIKWQQFIFHKQWQQLKEYCHELGIRLFGDMPIYVAYDSCDVWANRNIFSIDKEGNKLFVAGTPPDDFNENGQLWGMPVFNWKKVQKQNYDWWLKRLRKNLEFFDVLRLDHFRGFSAYWQVKEGEATALKGEWIKAPGDKLFAVLQKQFRNLPFVAEDLGEIDDSVYKLRDDFQLPGMEVLLFAFGDNMATNVHIPHNHIPMCVVYTGTHDTNTVLGWFASLTQQQKKNVEAYFGVKITGENVCGLLCRAAYASVSKLVILPLQDVLELGEEARMNTPSTNATNWHWRVTSKQMNTKVEKKLGNWCKIYNRTEKESKIKSL